MGRITEQSIANKEQREKAHELILSGITDVDEIIKQTGAKRSDAYNWVYKYVKNKDKQPKDKHPIDKQTKIKVTEVQQTATNFVPTFDQIFDFQTELMSKANENKKLKNQIAIYQNEILSLQGDLSKCKRERDEAILEKNRILSKAASYKAQAEQMLVNGGH